MSLSKTTLQILVLVCIFAGLSGYNFMRAAWTAPSATPPASNVSAPINVGANYQVKPGDLGAIRMRAGAYCDASGLNCFDPDTAAQYGGTYIYRVGYGGINAVQAGCVQINPFTNGCSCPTDYSEVVVRTTYTQGNCSGSTQNCSTVVDERTVACTKN